MPVRRILALGGATFALLLISAAAAVAAGTTVSVRVEGLNRTLLPTTIVHTHAGPITKDGTPGSTCPATSAAGALNVATHGRWGGSYSSSEGLSVTQILGETHTFTSPNYWSFWVNNRYATSGICGEKLHAGEQLLFAAVSQKGNPFPIVLSGPSHATAGRPFELKVMYYNARSKATPLAGAHVRGAGLNAVSSKQGIVSAERPAHRQAEVHGHQVGLHPRRAGESARLLGVLRRTRTALAALATVIAVGGCGLGAGPGTGDVTLTVTQGFGARPIAAVSAAHVPGSETVMRMLERSQHVGTRYGGGFVESIDGHAGSPRRRDWFYYVNGVQAPQGAATTAVHRNDRIWFDLHDWQRHRLDPRRGRIVPGAVRQRRRRQALPGHARVRVRRHHGLQAGDLGAVGGRGAGRQPAAGHGIRAGHAGSRRRHLARARARGGGGPDRPRSVGQWRLCQVRGHGGQLTAAARSRRAGGAGRSAPEPAW